MPDEECLRSVLLRRYGWRDDVAVVEVKIDRIGRDYIRTGLISAVKSEFIDATVLRIVAVDKSFDTRVPRRQLEPSKVIDLINKPVDARGVPLDTLRTGSSYLVAILRPGRKGFFLVDAVPLKSAP